ncbi:MAG TPA: sigma-54 dependent transcriptional regulator, partial [Spirochaetia bacterium]|nr:sigma-54 dependent transcriptional regulator [Spirochaetia bacterium]
MLYHSDEMRFKILIIDDEIGMCVSLSKILSAQGYENIYTSDPTEVDRLLSAEDIDLIIMDVKMPGIDGISLLKSIKTRGSRIPIIMISGYASVENIVRAMKFGALNFYKKPIHIKELIAEIQRISEARCSENDGKTVHKIITQDPKIQKLLSIVEKVAVTDVPVVITGESGTGKELFAEVIHEMSPRREGPLIKINCAAIPETLIESELFGYEKGAFTDAKNTRIGRFEEANGGSVFLDEIGEMNIKTQAKLLRVLQEKEFQRLGSNSVHKTDVRFIAASNRDFEELIANNLFREDLYYRLSVIRLEIPSLRERKGDILLLSNYFLDTFNRIYG